MQASLRDPRASRLSASMGPALAGPSRAYRYEDRSTSGSVWPLLSVNRPTAVHEFLEVQDTPVNVGAVAPGGTGTAWMVHRDPFHVSANGLESAALPTAVQAFVELQDNPARAGAVPRRPGVGIAWFIHPCPFQRAANARGRL